MAEQLKLSESRPVDEGPNRVLRVGGGVTVCVIEVDSLHPDRTAIQTIALRRARQATPMPFDTLH